MLLSSCFTSILHICLRLFAEHWLGSSGIRTHLSAGGSERSPIGVPSHHFSSSLRWNQFLGRSGRREQTAELPRTSERWQPAERKSQQVTRQVKSPAGSTSQQLIQREVDESNDLLSVFGSTLRSPSSPIQEEDEEKLSEMSDAQPHTMLSSSPAPTDVRQAHTSWPLTCNTATVELPAPFLPLSSRPQLPRTWRSPCLQTMVNFLIWILTPCFRHRL